MRLETLILVDFPHTLFRLLHYFWLVIFTRFSFVKQSLFCDGRYTTNHLLYLCVFRVYFSHAEYSYILGVKWHFCPHKSHTQITHYYRGCLTFSYTQMRGNSPTQITHIFCGWIDIFLHTIHTQITHCFLHIWLFLYLFLTPILTHLFGYKIDISGPFFMLVFMAYMAYFKLFLLSHVMYSSGSVTFLFKW